jgi:hypothetical protein
MGCTILGSLKILIFIDVLGGFAPATAAAPGAIALKKLQHGFYCKE